MSWKLYNVKYYNGHLDNKPIFKDCIRFKQSSGIVLCHYNDTSKEYEVVLVQRRYTYAFFEFIQGDYSMAKKSYYMYLQNMTVNELIMIYSSPFEVLWHFIWLDNGDEMCFKECKQKFEMNWGNRSELRKIILKVRSHGKLEWMFPRGQSIRSKNETPIECAIREFKEETGISSECYTIIPEYLYVVEYIHLEIKYIMKFYMAILKSEYYQRLSEFKLSLLDEATCEVHSIKWCSISYIKSLPILLNLNLEFFISPALNILRRMNSMEKFIKRKTENYKI